MNLYPPHLAQQDSDICPQMAPPILYRVIFGTTRPEPWQSDRVKLRPALLHGYQRRKVKGCDYPGITPLSLKGAGADGEEPTVRGVYATGLLDMDVVRLDRFEGGEYDRVEVKVELLDQGPKTSGGVEAETYVFRYVEELEEGEWDFEHFKREKMAAWTGDRDDYQGMCSRILPVLEPSPSRLTRDH